MSEETPITYLRRRVLLATTDPQVRSSLVPALEDAGFHVAAILDERMDILRFTRAVHPDIILLDAALSEQNGLEIASELHERRLAPIILLGDAESAKSLRRSKENPLAAFIARPFDTPNVLAAIEIAVHRWTLEQKVASRNRWLQKRLYSREVVDAAKCVLMDQHGLKEQEAYRRIQQISMNTRRSMNHVAESILQAHRVYALAG